MAHSTYVHMYAPSADHTSIILLLYVLLQFIICILRSGTKIVEEEQFSATKWSQGELIHSLFWFQREYLGGGGRNGMTAHLMQRSSSSQLGWQQCHSNVIPCDFGSQTSQPNKETCTFTIYSTQQLPSSFLP